VISRPWALVPLFAPFVYVTALVLPSFPPAATGVFLALLLSVAVAGLAAVPSPRLRPAALGSFLFLAVVVAVSLAVPGGFGGFGFELASGLALGIPLMAMALVWQKERPVEERMVLYGAALTWGIILLATRASLDGAGTAYTGRSFATAFYQVNSDQVTGLVGLMNGSGYTSLPIHSLFDPVFAVLAGASVLGLLLDLVRPQSGRGDPLPIVSVGYRERPTERELQRTHGFSAAQREVFRERSTSQPSPTTWPPGLLPVVWGAGVASVFLLVAVVSTTGALVVVAGAALVVAVLLILLADLPEAMAWLPLTVLRAQRPPPPTREFEEWLDRQPTDAPDDGSEPTTEAGPSGASR
jgi:hypothetical protein